MKGESLQVGDDGPKVLWSLYYVIFGRSKPYMVSFISGSVNTGISLAARKYVRYSLFFSCRVIHNDYRLLPPHSESQVLPSWRQEPSQAEAPFLFQSTVGLTQLLLALYPVPPGSSSMSLLMVFSLVILAIQPIVVGI